MIAASPRLPRLSMNAASHVATRLGTSQQLSHLQRHSKCPRNLLLFVSGRQFFGTLSLRFNGHLPGEPGLAGVY